MKRAASFVLSVMLGLSALIALGPAVGAQDAPDGPVVSVPRIIPEPNSGVAPKSATDRGGWVQYAIFWGIVAALLIIGGLVWLESRRKLRAREAAKGATP